MAVAREVRADGSVPAKAPEVPVIIHVDADAFFASVEQRDAPRLRGRPFVVAAEVVACASYGARALGVRSGMPLGRVVRRWPEVTVVPPRVEAYERTSADLFALLRRYTPLVEPGSIEEAFLDVAAAGDPVELARDLRRAARAELGLPVSAGVGRTKLIAKLASRRAKPDGLVVIDAAAEAALRPTLRLRDLWGVGPATVAPLEAAGLRTVADLATLDEAALRTMVSTGMARRLLAIAAGTDDARIRLPRPRRSVAAQHTISPPTRTRSKVLALLDSAVSTALRRLGDDSRTPRRMQVVVRFDDNAVVSIRGALPRPTTDRATIEAVARRLLAGTGYESDGRGVTLVGVKLPLPAAPATPGQLTLPLDGRRQAPARS